MTPAPNRLRRRLLVAIAILILLGAAVILIILKPWTGSGGSAKTTPPPPLNPCQLLTKNQVEQVLGTPVMPGQLDSTKLRCSWTSTSKGPATSLELQMQAGNLTLPSANYTPGSTLPSPTPPVNDAVSGIGEGAIFVEGQYTPSLLVRKRPYVLTFTVFDGAVEYAAVKPLEKSLAADALKALATLTG